MPRSEVTIHPTWDVEQAIASPASTEDKRLDRRPKRPRSVQNPVSAHRTPALQLADSDAEYGGPPQSSNARYRPFAAFGTALGRQPR
jgi:hypothetical protein